MSLHSVGLRVRLCLQHLQTSGKSRAEEKFNQIYQIFILKAVLNAKTLDFATHYLVLKLDYGEGIPKLCSIR